MLPTHGLNTFDSPALFTRGGRAPGRDSRSELSETKVRGAEFDGNKSVPEYDRENDAQATSRS